MSRVILRRGTKSFNTATSTQCFLLSFLWFFNSCKLWIPFCPKYKSIIKKVIFKLDSHFGSMLFLHSPLLGHLSATHSSYTWNWKFGYNGISIDSLYLKEGRNKIIFKKGEDCHSICHGRDHLLLGLVSHRILLGEWFLLNGDCCHADSLFVDYIIYSRQAVLWYRSRARQDHWLQ